MAATAEEDAIIRKRYLTQTVATAGNALPPFKKLVKKYMQFTQVLDTGTVEEAERLYSELLADLYSIQFHMQKQRAASEAFQADQAAYASKQAQLEEQIAQAERDIEARKHELEDARLELAHKQEYEAVRKQVMQVPARSATQAEQQAAQREIADLQQQSASLDALFLQRKRQFAGVLAALEQVQRSIERDEPPEESVATLPAQQGGSGGSGGNGAAAVGSKQQQQPMQVG